MGATTHSAAVKELLHVSVQPLIAEVWFPLLLRGPSPASPAPPGSPGRTRRARDARGGGKSLHHFPPRPAAGPGPAPRAGSGRSPRGSARGAKGNPSRRRRGASPQPGGGIFHLRRSTLQPPSYSANETHSYYFLLLATSWAHTGARFLRGFVRKPARLHRRGESDQNSGIRWCCLLKMHHTVFEPGWLTGGKNSRKIASVDLSKVYQNKLSTVLEFLRKTNGHTSTLTYQFTT